MIKTTKNNLQRNAGGFLLMVTEFGYSGISHIMFNNHDQMKCCVILNEKFFTLYTCISFYASESNINKIVKNSNFI